MAGLFGSFVVPDFLAQPADLATWMGTTAPANATALLRAATSLVLAASGSSYYSVNPVTGLATDATVAAVLRDATCIQATAWFKLGIDPDLGGVVVAGVASQKSIGTAHLAYADATQAAAAKAASLTTLVPAAVRKLQENDLLDSNVWVYG
jgi:hypothetical protein